MRSLDSASDRRSLLTTWYMYFKAMKKAFQGEAKRKYFEHASSLLTADGTDDDLVKLERAHLYRYLKRLYVGLI